MFKTKLVCIVENEDGTTCQFESGDKILVSRGYGERIIETCEVIEIGELDLLLEPTSGPDEGCAGWYDIDGIRDIRLWA